MNKYQKYKLLKKLHLISKSKYKLKTAKYTKEYRAIADSGLFSVKYYLKHNPDVRAEGVDPILHYLVNGWKENRDCTPYFDNAQYLRDNPDVKTAQMNPLAHFVIHGQKEGRKACITKHRFYGRGELCHSKVIKLFFLIPIYGWKLYQAQKVWSILGIPLFSVKRIVKDVTSVYCLFFIPVLKINKKKI